MVGLWAELPVRRTMLKDPGRSPKATDRGGTARPKHWMLCCAEGRSRPTEPAHYCRRRGGLPGGGADLANCLIERIAGAQLVDLDEVHHGCCNCSGHDAGDAITESAAHAEGSGGRTREVLPLRVVGQFDSPLSDVGGR